MLKYATRSRLSSSLTYWASGWSESARTCIRMIEGVSRIDAAAGRRRYHRAGSRAENEGDENYRPLLLFIGKTFAPYPPERRRSRWP